MAFAEIPGTDEMLVLGEKNLRDRLYIDATQALQARTPVTGTSASTAPLDPDVVGGSATSLRRIGVTMSGLQAACREAAITEVPGVSIEKLASQNPETFMGIGEETAARGKASENIIVAVREAGMPEYAPQCRMMLLGRCFDGFHCTLTEEPPAYVEPMRVTHNQAQT